MKVFWTEKLDYHQIGGKERQANKGKNFAHFKKHNLYNIKTYEVRINSDIEDLVLKEISILESMKAKLRPQFLAKYYTFFKESLQNNMINYHLVFKYHEFKRMKIKEFLGDSIVSSIIFFML